jgi:hypothetical protein
MLLKHDDKRDLVKRYMLSILTFVQLAIFDVAVP